MKGENNNTINKNYANIVYSHRLSWFILFVLFSLGMNTSSPGTFKTGQKKHERVQQAYLEKEKDLQALFREKGFSYENFSLLFVAFKYEKELQVYIREKSGKIHELLKTYDFCVLSGTLGPKRKEGDGQVPEGLYEISKFNPLSNFHLSLKVNYPNASDRVLSDPTRPGGEIFIHGNCVSTGCIPITDELIKELYVLSVEAWDQHPQIPVYIFPFKMTDENLKWFKQMDWGPDVENLWTDLKPVYDEFMQKKDIIRFQTDKKGRYHLL